MKEIWFVTFDYGNDENLEAYKDFCEANEMEFTETGYYNYGSDLEADDWNELRVSVESYFGSAPVVVTGTLGLWDGTHDIYATPIFGKCPLWSAIQKCCVSMDFVEVGFEDGSVYVTATHHDGTNRFEIRPMAKKGVPYFEKHGTHPVEDLKGLVKKFPKKCCSEMF